MKKRVRIIGHNMRHGENGRIYAKTEIIEEKNWEGK